VPNSRCTRGVVLEARVGAERIEARPQQDARLKSLLVPLFEPSHDLIRISERCVDHGPRLSSQDCFTKLYEVLVASL
jgi:hypothetical protein